MQKTSHQFSSWYFQDDAWSGRWINNPEGYVDAEDMDLSKEPIAIDMKVTDGVIDGTIATRQICAAIPFFDFLLIRGNVSATRTSARVIVWDIFEGHRRDVAALDLKREAGVMIVVPKEGAVDLFPLRSRVAIDSNTVASEAPFCEGKEEAIAKLLGQMLKERGSAAPRTKSVAP